MGLVDDVVAVVRIESLVRFILTIDDGLGGIRTGYALG
jgi:hypothetical protein